MDTLKQDHFLCLLENAEIDLVVVDEAHKLSKGRIDMSLAKFSQGELNFCIS